MQQRGQRHFGLPPDGACRREAADFARTTHPTAVSRSAGDAVEGRLAFRMQYSPEFRQMLRALDIGHGGMDEQLDLELHSSQPCVGASNWSRNGSGGKRRVRRPRQWSVQNPQTQSR